MQFHTAIVGYILKVCNAHGEKVAIVKWQSQKCILNKPLSTSIITSKCIDICPHTLK